MENSRNPQPTPQFMQQDSQFPPQNSGQPELTFGPDGKPTTGIKLETPILSPTQTAENLRNYNGPYPMNQPAPRPQMQPVQPVQAIKSGINSTSLTILSVVLGILAIVGLGLGVFGLVDSASSNAELQTAKAEIAEKNAIISAVEKQTGAKISSVKDVPTYSATTGHIYLTEWGVKIKIPSELHRVSYILNMRNYHPAICFNAVETGITDPIPVFADVTQNPGGMGCLTRIAEEEGDRSAEGYSYGERVLTDNGFNYFYTGPANTYSTNLADLPLERHAVSLIKTMLNSENVSTYH